MPAEIEAKCLLGNGVCPETCLNYEVALKLTKEFGDEIDPFLTRFTIFFGVDPDKDRINVFERALARCAAEGNRKRSTEDRS